METSTGGEIDRFQSSVDKLGRIAQSLGASSNTSEARINVYAGGIGIYIASVCCAIMLAISIAGSILGSMAYFSMQQRMDRMQDYLNAIYVIAPQLKPKDTSNGNDKH